MDLQLKDKVIIVSGGAKGIGRGIAGVLAREGAIPFIIGRECEQDNNQRPSHRGRRRPQAGAAFVAISAEQSRSLAV